jgi:hypothetical protein
MVFLSICCSPAFSDKQVQSFKAVDMTTSARDSPTCNHNSSNLRGGMFWMDNEHIMVRLTTICFSSAPQKSTSENELLAIDLNGNVRSTQQNDLFSFMRAANGALIVSHNSTIDILDTKLRVKQTLKCSTDVRGCAVFAPSLLPDNSDFALCSQAAFIETCNFYRGQPATDIPQRALSFPVSNRIYRTPYKTEQLPDTIKASWYSRHPWKVSQLETWYFDKNGVLTSLNSTGTISAVSPERWTSTDGSCAGELSISEPRRFLAFCNGTHFYTDGDLDSIFGYSRIALFDVSSRHILARIDGPAYTSAALSPNGQLISVLHGKKVHLYRVTAQ